MNRTVFITSATTGIGEATAKTFAKNGYNLILTGRKVDRLEKIKNKLKDKYAIKVKTLAFDIRKKSKIKHSLKFIKEDLDNIDILINHTAPAIGNDAFHKENIHDWEELIDSNLKGLLHITKHLAPHMIKRRKGQVINVGFTAGPETLYSEKFFSIHKRAIDTFTKSIAIDLQPHGIRVGQVSTGQKETIFNEPGQIGDKENALKNKSFTSLRPKDVAASIYFMATQPKHVNIQEILLMSTHQASV